MEYTCPYCKHDTIIARSNSHSHDERIDITYNLLDGDGYLWVSQTAIACPNTDCKKLSLTAALYEDDGYGNLEDSTLRHEWQLLPESSAKPQPSYIPKQIVNDYNEACRIRSLSPKASATLARRCLQGMIRDFWSIKKGTLNEEVKALEEKVDPEVWASIDAVRSVGNIGAHMEKDVNVIVDIEPEEAGLLIELIEDLFDEWYVARHNRQERNKKIQALAESKKQAKTPDKTA